MFRQFLIPIILGAVVCACLVSTSGAFQDDILDNAVVEEFDKLEGLGEIDEHVHVRGMATDAEQNFDYDPSSKSSENEWNENDEEVDSARWEALGLGDVEEEEEFDEEEAFEEENFDVHGLSAEGDNTTEGNDTAGDDDITEGDDIEDDDITEGDDTTEDDDTSQDEDLEDSDLNGYEDWNELDGEDYNGNGRDLGVGGLSVENPDEQFNTEDEEELNVDRDEDFGDEEDWEDISELDEKDYEAEEDADSGNIESEVDVRGLAALINDESAEGESGENKFPVDEEIEKPIAERFQDSAVDNDGGNEVDDGQNWVSDGTFHEEDVKVSGQAFVAHDGGKSWENWEKQVLEDLEEGEALRNEDRGQFQASGRYDRDARDNWDTEEDFSDGVSAAEGDEPEMDVSGRSTADGEEEELEEWGSFSSDESSDAADFEDGVDGELFEGSVHADGSDDFIDDATIDGLIAFAEEAGLEDEDSSNIEESRDEKLQGQSVVTRDGELHDPYLVEIDDFESSRRDTKIDFAGEEPSLSGQSAGVAGHGIGEDFEGHVFGGEQVNADELFESTVAAFEV